MTPKFWAFSFSVVFGLALAIGLTMVLGRVPMLATNGLLGLSWNNILAICIALPITDLARRRIFGWNSLGERL